MGSPGRKRTVLARALLIGITIPGAGCTLVQPGCHNRDVKAAIEQEARASVELWTATARVGAFAAESPVTLVEALETGRTENTRTCAAKIAVGTGDTSVSVPIEYEVIAGNDGQISYRWDNESFGKTYLGTAVMSGLAKAMRPAPEKTQPSNEEPQYQAPQDAPADLAGWAKGVHAELRRRAGQLTAMPRGAQHMRFRVGSEGEVTVASAVGPIEKPELAERLVAFLNSTARLQPPPDGQVKFLDVTFRF